MHSPFVNFNFFPHFSSRAVILRAFIISEQRSFSQVFFCWNQSYLVGANITVSKFIFIPYFFFAGLGCDFKCILSSSSYKWTHFFEYYNMAKFSKQIMNIKKLIINFVKMLVEKQKKCQKIRFLLIDVFPVF